MLGVLDTNVLASAAIAQPGGSLAMLLAAIWAGVFDLVVSQHILDEFARTLAKPYFTRRIAATDSQTYRAAIARRATLIPITATVQGVATHSEDDLVLATAVSASADYLVTGDGQLQRLGSYQGVVILSPHEFVRLLLP